ncbi:PAS domain S-box-containing protein/diguanylate cyclase (GGDEF) domain-containing protein [Allopseudospirillum japonicum]|uniref:cyclic-guanylate-specific phosphodiesterase n=1 Tax=Allopseudospirillum japonicum TaxID=64971 RepID=A0A1H6UF09_9GAMM|nr:EAL domain-containing protein [Allopseudospirillum japonicum]SEI90911.1 PAS domain S-box-containing protein/diguanylate cyclase (GGDEF) domain-containing protein [Allopseudospirillum japonicum]
MWASLSLRWKFPALLLSTGLFFALYLFVFHIPQSISNTGYQWLSTVHQMLALQQGSFNDHLRAGRFADLEMELADLGTIEGIQWAFVADAHNQVQASTRLAWRGQKINELNLLQFDASYLNKTRASGRHQLQKIGTHTYLSYYPLRQQSYTLAADSVLVVRLDFSYLMKNVQYAAVVQALEAIGVLVALALVLMVLIHRWITQRLAKIDTCAVSVSQGRYEARVHFDGQDEISQLATTFNELAEQIQAERQRIVESEQRMRAILTSSPDAIIVVNASLTITNSNPAAQQLFGLAPAQLHQKPLAELLSPLPNLHPQTYHQETRTSTQESLGVHVSGVNFDAEVTSAAAEVDGNPHFILIVRDVSERKRTQAKLDYLAYHDILTSAHNRTYLLTCLERVLNQTPAPTLALLYIDLDHFKTINDSLGHELGDELLCAVADRLGTFVEIDGVLARLSGDDFVLFVQGELDQASVNTLANRVLNAFELPFELRGYDLFLTVSIGITLHKKTHLGARQLLKEADLAMYEAKRLGRSTACFYDMKLAAALEERMALENELRQALMNGEFELFYQPQISVSDTQCAVVEALLRWHSPARGVVSPVVFIPVLEETGMILEVTAWVLRQSCRQAKIWRQQGINLRISVNLSALDFRQTDLVSRIEQILQDEAVQADWIELEITESALLDDIDRTLCILHQLKELGLSVLMDDFGTGYSSLSYLKRFPFDGLKIDRNFVKDLPEDTSDAALVSAVLAMAKAMGLDVVAEGVETVEQQQMLADLGCPRLQGYLFSRPVSAQELLALDMFTTYPTP